MNPDFVPEINPNMVALKGCRKDWHGPWDFIRKSDGTLRHVCNTCGYWEEKGLPGQPIKKSTDMQESENARIRYEP